MSTEQDQLNKMDSLFACEGIEHFSAKEVCTMRKAGNAIAIPPEELWARLIPTLLLAEKIREYMGHPLSVGNGYRPRDYNKAVGGARNSQHIHFRALDLDLPNNDRSRANQEKYYEYSCELWLESKEQKMGLGLYRAYAGTRVHIDAGYRYRNWKRKYTQPILDGLK